MQAGRRRGFRLLLTGIRPDSRTDKLGIASCREELSTPGIAQPSLGCRLQSSQAPMKNIPTILTPKKPPAHTVLTTASGPFGEKPLDSKRKFLREVGLMDL